MLHLRVRGQEVLVRLVRLPLCKALGVISKGADRIAVDSVDRRDLIDEIVSELEEVVL